MPTSYAYKIHASQKDTSEKLAKVDDTLKLRGESSADVFRILKKDKAVVSHSNDLINASQCIIKSTFDCARPEDQETYKKFRVVTSRLSNLLDEKKYDNEDELTNQKTLCSIAETLASYYYHSDGGYYNGIISENDLWSKFKGLVVNVFPGKHTFFNPEINVQTEAQRKELINKYTKAALTNLETKDVLKKFEV
jgi:hypothetical protein